jgi:hypothetical protein
MLASQAGIVFPVLLFLEGAEFYHHALDADDLLQHRGGGEPDLVGHEIVDSAGQRFLIRALVDVRVFKVEQAGPRWKRWIPRWIPEPLLYRFDLELEPLSPTSFDETHRRVMEMEWAEETYYLMEGAQPDEPESRRRLERCRSIADIIAIEDPSYHPPHLTAEAAGFPRKSGALLASEAPIVFPALLFYTDGGCGDAVLGPENLRYASGVQMSGLLDRQMVDSSGQRFRIYRFLDIQERLELRRKRGWLDFGNNGRIYHFDLELEPMPSVAFEDTHRQVVASEAKLDGALHRQGRRPRSQEDKQRLEQCRSIAEVIAHLALEEVGTPPAQSSVKAIGM